MMAKKAKSAQPPPKRRLVARIIKLQAIKLRLQMSLDQTRRAKLILNQALTWNLMTIITVPVVFRLVVVPPLCTRAPTIVHTQHQRQQQPRRHKLWSCHLRRHRRAARELPHRSSMWRSWKSTEMNRLLLEHPTCRALAAYRLRVAWNLATNNNSRRDLSSTQIHTLRWKNHHRVHRAQKRARGNEESQQLKLLRTRRRWKSFRTEQPRRHITCWAISWI